jgi:hypothetical protein
VEAVEDVEDERQSDQEKDHVEWGDHLIFSQDVFGDDSGVLE